MKTSRATRGGAAPSLGRLDHLTFRGNAAGTRHGWLRLTPAYSVRLVEQLLDERSDREGPVLDPFCGTGTTALACAERGVSCTTTDINPFLLWFAGVKTRSYADEELLRFQNVSEWVRSALQTDSDEPPWLPPLHQIDKWWPARTLSALGRAFTQVRELQEKEAERVVDLLKVALCQTLITHAHVSFGHQSMSFRGGAMAANEPEPELERLAATWDAAVASLGESARSPVRLVPRVLGCDARQLDQVLPNGAYHTVITSPPYPNRMSYIRELRPYMYWLGYLSDGRAAGELDWRAIGGTWGVATSYLGKWSPPAGSGVDHAGFEGLLEGIAMKSRVLSRYVHKYFVDMALHCRAVFAVVAPGGSVHYIVGNSKFYDTLVPVEAIFASLFESAGFERTEVRAIRKRSSKKELYEFVVSAHKPAG